MRFLLACALLLLPLPVLAGSGDPVAACASSASAGAPSPAASALASLLSRLPGGARDSVCLAPGLQYFEYACPTGGGRTVSFRETLRERGARIGLRAIRNAGALADPSCPSGYGGTDIRSLASDRGILAATNGNFFMRASREPSGREGFVSIGLIWSLPSDGAGTGSLLAPARAHGGNSLLVVDSSGAHELRISLSRCGRETCVSARARTELARPRPQAEFLRALAGAFPGMSLAMQLNMDIAGRAGYASCPDESSTDWRCRSAARTALCARSDGSVSLITSSAARVEEMARALRPGGTCHAECTLLFNLDGGGSTQMAIRRPGAGDGFEVHGDRTGSSRPESCGEYRPVDDYLAWVAPTGS